MTKIAIDLEIVIKDPPMMGDAKGSDLEILDEISKLTANEEKEWTFLDLTPSHYHLYY